MFLLTAEDCSDSGHKVSKENSLISMFQDIEAEFVKDELTSEILSAFEKRAIQKLSDLDDYLNIYADTSLSKEFRLQARQMIKESFNSEMDLQTYFKNIELSEDTLNDIIYYSEKEGSFITEINSIIIKDNFQKQISSSYVGELGFSQKNRNNYSDENTDVKSFILNAKMHVLKIEKEFGKESQDVWEVYFGEIK